MRTHDEQLAALIIQQLDEDLEYVWLGDVETGHYASVLGSPGYQEAVKAHARGDKVDPPTTDPEQFLHEFTPNGRSIASLLKTGFLSAQDYVLLDTSASTLTKIREAGGDRGLDTFLTLATPRKEKFKRQLLDKYDQDNELPPEKRSRVARLEDFQPGVQTYVWALDEAARKRERTRMRRRATARGHLRELRYDAYLRRGGAPFRGVRLDAESRKPVEELLPLPGKAYIEGNHIVAYWFDPTLKRWARMVGVDTAAELKRKALLATKKVIKDDPHHLKRKEISYGSLNDKERAEIFKCVDKAGNKTLNLHQAWFEHKYSLPANSGHCNGLCIFDDGWLLPEGEDGVPSDIELAFDEQGEALPTHVTCVACNIRLCRKCYFTLLKHHTSTGAHLAKFVEIYHLYRQQKEQNPVDFTTYPNFLNYLRRNNPQILRFAAEDPALSGDYASFQRRQLEDKQGAEHQQAAQERVAQRQQQRPQNPTPRKQTPEKQTPQRKTPQRKTPERKTPERQTPQRKTPERKTPQRQTPQRKTPERQAPQRKTPERKTPETRTPPAAPPPQVTRKTPVKINRKSPTASSKTTENPLQTLSSEKSTNPERLRVRYPILRVPELSKDSNTVESDIPIGTAPAMTVPAKPAPAKPAPAKPAPAKPAPAKPVAVKPPATQSRRTPPRRSSSEAAREGQPNPPLGRRAARGRGRGAGAQRPWGAGFDFSEGLPPGTEFLD